MLLPRLILAPDPGVTVVIGADKCLVIVEADGLGLLARAGTAPRLPGLLVSEFMPCCAWNIDAQINGFSKN
jgi:hypothetical protein